jgi:uncharacterized protein YjbI with pentapeptide repeats
VSDDPVEIREATFHSQRVGPMELAPNSEVVDVRFEDCDLVGVLGQKARLERVTVSGGRLRGVTWAGGVIRDVLVENVASADLSCRFSSLRNVVVRDALLPGVDLTEVTFDQVLFERCDMPGAKFDHAKVKNLRFASCNLAGATGAVDLRGASMPLDDVLSLAPSLAREIGIAIEPAPA